jgi:hypothetical protein
MSFKHPEILYALLLLLIPVIIHLVRWKKFKSQVFTNVDFLQELEIKSRKSRKLKELIVLLLRLAVFTFLILAFAQWFRPSKASQEKNQDNLHLIFLDNSLSMTAMQGKTNLWQTYLQEFSKYIDKNQTYTLLTNDRIYNNVQGKHLIKMMYDIPFSNNPVKHNEILKKINLILQKNKNRKATIIYASDLQDVYNEQFNDSLFQSKNEYYFLTNQIKNLADISIDSLWLTGKDHQNYFLNLQLSAGNSGLQTPVSIVQNKEILWRSNIGFKDSLKQVIPITLPVKKSLEASVVINDNGFLFNNKLFFTIHQPEKIKILIVGQNIPGFFDKIYTEDEFIVDKTLFDKINYSKLNNYDFIILYRLKDPERLSATAFNKFVKQYGNLLIIPPDDNPVALQTLLTSLQINTVVQTDTTQSFLNRINYDHPFFKGIFLKKVKNFAYPSVRKHYKLSRKGEWLYRLNDQSVFASVYHHNGNIYLINNSLDDKNTNFAQAPSLIVPLLYQMGLYTNRPQKLYYIKGEKNNWQIKAETGQDDILELQHPKEKFIPLQNKRFNYVVITTDKKPLHSGIYDIMLHNRKIGSVAFNDNRKEKRLQFLKLPDLPNIFSIDSLERYVTGQQEIHREKLLWKWLLFLALLFLIAEMMIIKYWK